MYNKIDSKLKQSRIMFYTIAVCKSTNLKNVFNYLSIRVTIKLVFSNFFLKITNLVILAVLV